ncbi:5-oxoprolinase subunit PxpA [Denitrificimonas sp. JX-1]|uniref:5-oxoprolinase subunit PxpA n=1 Tax=Denitrificimonas halotolerans TaxID=3098930 RepID=A0ABU5GPY7_9GAMM|nr:5-oxoprolinase subunit PxpA [Denitrificimonas sp. JX-1]MDY7218251.1 5-oxoprolinase subunit PxpA [Denitrificimonas sp. JX-1]
MAKLLLNADVGESLGAWVMGDDEALMPLIDLANIACGFHASDPDIMRTTVRLAAEHDVTVGAHPSYPDLIGFGRRSMTCTEQQVENFILYQVGALAAICHAVDTQLHYVKPHGALYSDMMKDHALLAAIMRGVSTFNPQLKLIVPAMLDPEPVQTLAKKYGLQLWFEVFADRAYHQDGSLVSRAVSGAVYHEQSTIVEQAIQLANGHPIQTLEGTAINLQADTLCVHGDNLASIQAAKTIHTALKYD